MIPSQGTLRRCPHGVYRAAGDGEKASYCSACTPGGPRDQRPVVLPPRSSDNLTTNGRVMANQHRGTGCPECGSAIYLRRNEKNDVARECADCGSFYAARRTTHQRALVAEAEAENE